MRYCLPSLLILSLSVGCGEDTPPPPPDAGPDAGTSAPDARVIERFDAGPIDAEALPEPTLNLVSPPSGSEEGGTRVTLRGSAFSEPAQVFFGDLEASSVVVLDEVSIAATTPPAALGPVTVTVITPGGTAELVDGFSYVRDVRLHAVEPAAVPETGGVEIALSGKGFDEKTLILFDRVPLRAPRLVSPERIEGFVPALSPGRPEIVVLNADARVSRSDLLRVFAEPRPTQLVPGYGPLLGGHVEAVAGDGFEEAEIVEIGGVSASDLTLMSGETIEILAPALAAEGPQDVVIRNADTSGMLPGGYVAFDPALAGQALVGVVPARVRQDTQPLVAIVGRGIDLDAVVSIGGVRATVDAFDVPAAVMVHVPLGLSLGPQDVDVFTRGSTMTLAGGVTVLAPVVLDAISPGSAGVEGGVSVAISGSGLSDVHEVRIADVPLSDIVVTDSEITGTLEGGAHGTHDVVVYMQDGEARLTDGFVFTEPFEIIRLDPIEGSVAGNTFVSVYGRGFEPGAGVRFDGIEGVDPQVENGSVLHVRTNPTAPGTAMVQVVTSTTHVVPPGYTFFDPRIVTGGAWGGPIDGAVNVGVINIGSGTPMPGMVVQLGLDADPRLAAVTDENGLATISYPDLRGAYTVTVGQNDIEFATFVEVDAKNLTFFVSPYPMSAPPDAPNQPCPMGGDPPVIRGKVFKFKSALDQNARPGWVPIARITYTQPSVFQANPPMPAEQVDFVFAEGQEYEIVTTRAGVVAVYAIMGDFNQEEQIFIPRKMGIARQVPSAPGETIEDVHIALDIDLDKSIEIRLDDPPVQLPGPSANAIFPFLNLDSEGVIPMGPTIVDDSDVVNVEGLPNLAGAKFFYMGGSYTQGADGGLTNPYSLTIAQSGDETDDGLDVGPFLKMPQNVSPKPGQVIEDSTFSWTIPGTQPDVVSINVLDVTAVGGCCCADLNLNGTCEDQEPLQCGGAPVQFSRWSVFAQGGQMSYPLPRMPSGVNAFDTPRPYFWLVQQGIAPRFNYAEFIYNQFSPFFWRSWTVWFSQFVAREETD